MQYIWPFRTHLSFPDTDLLFPNLCIREEEKEEGEDEEGHREEEEEDEEGGG